MACRETVRPSEVCLVHDAWRFKRSRAGCVTALCVGTAVLLPSVCLAGERFTRSTDVTVEVEDCHPLDRDCQASNVDLLKETVDDECKSACGSEAKLISQRMVAGPLFTEPTVVTVSMRVTCESLSAADRQEIRDRADRARKAAAAAEAEQRNKKENAAAAIRLKRESDLEDAASEWQEVVDQVGKPSSSQDLRLVNAYLKKWESVQYNVDGFRFELDAPEVREAQQLRSTIQQAVEQKKRTAANVAMVLAGLAGHALYAGMQLALGNNWGAAGRVSPRPRLDGVRVASSKGLGLRGVIFARPGAADGSWEALFHPPVRIRFRELVGFDRADSLAFVDKL